MKSPSNGRSYLVTRCVLLTFAVFTTRTPLSKKRSPPLSLLAGKADSALTPSILDAFGAGSGCARGVKQRLSATKPLNQKPRLRSPSKTYINANVALHKVSPAAPALSPGRKPQMQPSGQREKRDSSEQGWQGAPNNRWHHRHRSPAHPATWNSSPCAPKPLWPCRKDLSLILITLLRRGEEEQAGKQGVWKANGD